MIIDNNPVSHICIFTSTLTVYKINSYFYFSHAYYMFVIYATYAHLFCGNFTCDWSEDLIIQKVFLDLPPLL